MMYTISIVVALVMFTVGIMFGIMISDKKAK